MTNYESAVNLLSTAKNVDHWNEIRSWVKVDLTTDEMSKIDGSGLIVKTLGPDRHNVYN